MKKEDFIKVLEVLEYTDMIGNYTLLKSVNAINICTTNEYGEEDYNYLYYFDENNNLIHPQIFEIKEKIKQLEQEKQEYEEKLKKLLTNN